MSSGIEPILRLEGRRRVRLPSGAEQTLKVEDYAWALWRAAGNPKPLPDYFVETRYIAPTDHLLMQTAMQPFVDASISKTVALQAEASAQEVARLYASAHALRLTGCTVFRQSSRAAVIDGLTVTDEVNKQDELDAYRCCPMKTDRTFSRSAAAARRGAYPQWLLDVIYLETTIDGLSSAGSN